MKSAGILNNKREGYWVRYGLNGEALLECRDRMSQVCDCGCEGSLESLQKYRDALKRELEEVNNKIRNLE
jgi:hypothetical protein